MGSAEGAEFAEGLAADDREKELSPGLVRLAFDQLPLSGSPADRPADDTPADGGDSIKELLPGGKIVGVKGGGGGISPYLPPILGGGLGAEYDNASGALVEVVSLV